MTATQPKTDPRPHRTAFYDVGSKAWDLSGDVVLVPDPDNLDGVTRDSLEKINHWSSMTEADIPRLGILTDSFFRFMDEGQDASVLTLWRNGTPMIQQIEGEPCEAAVDAVMDALTNMKPLIEKWSGLPPLEAEIEKLAYQKGYKAGHRPKWLERQARRNLEERDVDPDAHNEPTPPVAANDNKPPAQETPAVGKAPLPVICPAQWHGQPVPAREWYLEGLIPNRQVTIVSGDGGVGKSLLTLQIAAAGALGVETLDMRPSAGRVCYIGAEDEADEFHRRLADIVTAHGKTLGDLLDFRLVPLADMDALLSVPDRRGTMQPTDLFVDVIDMVTDFLPGLIILDTAADLFGGDEIKRGQVRQFIGMLRKVAIPLNCAVVLLTHPSVSGMQSGSGSSGSTAWNNSVRSRLYLTRPEGKDADPDLRFLTTKKANYGTVGGEIKLRWKDGVFVIDDGKPAAGSMLIAAKAERVFRDVLSAINRTGERVAKTKGVNYAPKVMADRPDAEGMSVKQLEAAMQRLMVAGELKVVMEGPRSKQRQRLILTSEDFGPDD